MPTIKTQCSGGELFGVGAKAAGFDHVEGYEIEDKIAAVARQNGFEVLTADVTQVDYATRPAADHLHASPSCKTASQANANAGETADDLAVALGVCRAIEAHAAQGGRSFSLENVVGYRWYESYDRICATLKRCGFVFETVAKGGERPDWRKTAPEFNDAGVFVDAADFGVPQNRKRLILRAVRLDWRTRVPGLRPTHGKRGGVLLLRWVGWYAAIADIVHDLPDTEPAPWQVKRLPKELRESLMITKHGAFNIDRDGLMMRATHEPSWTVRASPRGEESAIAYLLGGGNTNLDDPTSHARPGDTPAFTLRDGRNGSPERALLLASNSNPNSWGGNHRWGDEPAQTTVPNAAGRARAWLLDGDNGRPDSGEPGYKAEHEPAMALRGSRAQSHRGLILGRWKLMDIRALGRFQTVPAWYQGLTPQINGNGVPCDLAEAIMRSFKYGE